MNVVKIGWVIGAIHIVRDELSVRVFPALLINSKILEEFECSGIQVSSSQ